MMHLYLGELHVQDGEMEGVDYSCWLTPPQLQPEKIINLRNLISG